MIDDPRLQELIVLNAETLCRRFLPGGKKLGAEWRLSSLAVRLRGPYAGSYVDWQSGQRGTFARLLMNRQSLTFPEAALEIGINLEICK
jgi:hypothetical protein